MKIIADHILSKDHHSSFARYRPGDDSVLSSSSPVEVDRRDAGVCVGVDDDQRSL